MIFARIVLAFCAINNLRHAKECAKKGEIANVIVDIGWLLFAMTAIIVTYL